MTTQVENDVSEIWAALKQDPNNQGQETLDQSVPQVLIGLISLEVIPNLSDVYFGNLGNHSTLHGSCVCFTGPSP